MAAIGILSAGDATAILLCSNKLCHGKSHIAALFYRVYTYEDEREEYYLK
jgi:hypothetical protein